MPQYELPVFPGHPHPHPDELLSSWVWRLARANRMNFAPFVSRFVHHKVQLDLDRKPDQRIAERLASKTAQSKEEVLGLSLLEWIPALSSEKEMRSSRPKWILPYGRHLKRLAASGNRPEAAPHERPCYPYCPICAPADALSPTESYVRKAWRLAFVTVCPEHERPLLEYHERPREKDLSSEEMQRLLHLQARLLDVLGGEHASRAMKREEGDTEDSLSPEELFAGLRKILLALISETRGRFLRLHLIEETGLSSVPSFGQAVRIETLPLRERRPLMLILAWFLSEWPTRLKEALRVGGVSYSSLKTSGSDERLGWLRPYAPEDNPRKWGSDMRTASGLRLEELFEARPIIVKQFALLGVSEKDIQRAALSDSEWKNLKPMFGSVRKQKRLMCHRTALSLLRLREQQGLSAREFPKGLARPVWRLTGSNRSRTKVLEEALDRLGES